MVDVFRHFLSALGLLYFHQAMLNFIYLRGRNRKAAAQSFNYGMLALLMSLYCFTLTINFQLSDLYLKRILIALANLLFFISNYFYFASLHKYTLYNVQIKKIIKLFLLSTSVVSFFGFICVIFDLEISQNYLALEQKTTSNLFFKEYLKGYLITENSWLRTILFFSIPAATVTQIGILAQYFSHKKPFDTIMGFGALFSLAGIFTGIVTVVGAKYAMPIFFITNAPEILRVTYLNQLRHWNKIKRLTQKLNRNLVLHNSKLKEEIEYRKGLEEKLQEEKKQTELALEVKSNFLSTINHELKTPISCAIGSVDFLEPRLNDQESKKYLKIARDNLSTLSIIVKNILSTINNTHYESVIEMEKVNLRDLLEGLVSSMSLNIRDKDLSLKLEIAHNVGYFYKIDRIGLQQILYNLIGNAIKFTPSGSVVVRVELRSRNDSEFHSIQISVEDSGIGIHDSILPFIFDKFYQADSSTLKKYDGVGLGLYVCKELVNKVGGTISVQNNRPVGSLFTVVIPARCFDNTSQNNSKSLTNLGQSKLRILIVEDNYDLREIYQFFFSDVESIDCRVASNPLEAMVILKNEVFNLIISDIMMPEMTGFDLLAKIRGPEFNLANLPIILLSGKSLDSFEMNIIKNDEQLIFLEKPINRANLLSAVSGMLDQSEFLISEC